MRLLYLSTDGGYKLIEFLNDDPLPPYAILSHTWFQTEQAEPTFSDLRKGSGKEKLGYKKVQFCGEQVGEMGCNTSGWILVASTKITAVSSQMQSIPCSASTATRTDAMCIYRM